jgi:hypothetical protein
MTCKGTLCQGFIRAYIMGIQSVMLVQYFRPSFVNCRGVASLTFSLIQLSPPPSVSQSTVQYINTACGWDGVGCMSPVVDHILQEFNNLYLARFRAYSTPNKNLAGEGPQADKKHAAKSLYRSIFFYDDNLLWFISPWHALYSVCAQYSTYTT